MENHNSSIKKELLKENRDFLFIIIYFFINIIINICKYIDLLICYIKERIYYILDKLHIDIHQFRYNVLKTFESCIIILTFLCIIFIIFVCVFIFIFISIFTYQIFTKINKKIYKKVYKIMCKSLQLLCIYIFISMCISAFCMLYIK